MSGACLIKIPVIPKSSLALETKVGSEEWRERKNTGGKGKERDERAGGWRERDARARGMFSKFAVK